TPVSVFPSLYGKGHAATIVAIDHDSRRVKRSSSFSKLMREPGYRSTRPKAPKDGMPSIIRWMELPLHSNVTKPLNDISFRKDRSLSSSCQSGFFTNFKAL